MRGARTQLFLGHIGANLRRARLSKGLTQQALAELADLDLSFVQRVERAEENLSADSLVKLADSVGLPSPAGLFRKATRPPTRRGRPPKRKQATRPP